MFSFIHAADIHLDSPLRGLSRYQSAPVQTIRSACRRAFSSLIDLAIKEKVAFLLLAGDLYDGDWKDYSAGIFFSQQMGRLQQNGIKVFMVKGNHDAANTITKSLELPKNVTLFSHKKPESIIIKELGVAIHGQSFASKSTTENLAENFPPAKSGLFNIGLLHTSLAGSPNHDSYAPCTLDDLRSKNYQYWALGHIHKAEIISKDPYIIFPGCIQGRHIREAGAKGCMLVQVKENNVATVSHRALDLLRWSTLQCCLTNISEKSKLLQKLRDKMIQELQGAEERTLALRIELTGKTSLARQLACDPEQLEQEIRAIAAEVADEELWIEQIKHNYDSKKSSNKADTNEENISELIQQIQDTSGNKDEIEGVEEIVSAFRKKIPLQALSSTHDFELNEEEISKLIDEAKEMLIAQLLNTGDAE